MSPATMTIFFYAVYSSIFTFLSPDCRSNSEYFFHTLYLLLVFWSALHALSSSPHRVVLLRYTPLACAVLSHPRCHTLSFSFVLLLFYRDYILICFLDLFPLPHCCFIAPASSVIHLPPFSPFPFFTVFSVLTAPFPLLFPHPAMPCAVVCFTFSLPLVSPFPFLPVRQIPLIQHATIFPCFCTTSFDFSFLLCSIPLRVLGPSSLSTPRAPFSVVPRLV